MHYWLVGKTGGLAKVVKMSGAPQGYDFVADLGPVNQSHTSLQSRFAQSVQTVPFNITVSDTLMKSMGFNAAPGGPSIDPTGGIASGNAALANSVGIPNPFAAVGDAITSVLDFLKLIAWLLHPRNILRAVEFLIGIALMFFGLHAAMQARGERMEGFVTSENALTRAGVGRVAAELGAAARRRERPRRPASAPHATRRKALRQRYSREEDLQRRRAKSPRPKKAKPKRKSVRQPAYT